MIIKEEIKLITKVIELNILIDNIEYKSLVYFHDDKIYDIYHKNDFKISKEIKSQIEEIINKHFAY